MPGPYSTATLMLAQLVCPSSRWTSRRYGGITEPTWRGLARKLRANNIRGRTCAACMQIAQAAALGRATDEVDVLDDPEAAAPRR